MLRSILLSAAIVLTSIPGTASAWIADNGLIVQATGDTTFEVPYRGLSGPQDFWCAAGNYVRDELGMSGNTRVYRTTSVPRRSGQGMSFSLSPDGAQPSGLAVLGRHRGISAAHAHALCPDGRQRF